MSIRGPRRDSSWEGCAWALQRGGALFAWTVCFLLAGSAGAQLTLEQVEFDRAQMDTLRAALAVAAPFTEQPTITILSPGRAGGIEGSVRTAEHDRQGTRRVAGGARLAWVAQEATPQSRLDLQAETMLHLLRVSPSSDSAGGATRRLLELAVTTEAGVARLDTAQRAVAAVAAGDLGFALDSDHEHVYDAEDWMVFDLFHESLEIRICDNLANTSAGATRCHDAFAQLTRRPNAPRRYQVKVGCLEACGEALFNLQARYADGRLDSMSTQFLIGDPRFNIAPELEVEFRSPAAAGQLSTRTTGRLIVSRGLTIGSNNVDWATLYQDAHPSRLDPNADRSP